MALLLLVVLLMFTVSFPGVNHGLSQMEHLSTKLLLGLRDNWKNPPRPTQISRQSSEVWIPQPNEARWRARTRAEGSPGGSA